MAKVEAKAGGFSKKQKAFRIKLVIFIVILVAYGVSVYFFRADIDRLLNIAKYGTAEMANLKDEKGNAASKESLTAGDMKIHYVDVGQGDATVIEFPDKKTMIIDGGKDREKTRFFTYMDESLPSVKSFDYAVLTHSDEDHCGGLDDILNKFPMKENGVIYRPNQVSNYKSFRDPALDKTGTEGFWGNYAEDAGKNTLAYMRAVDAAYKQKAAGVKVLVTDATVNKIPFKTAAGENVKDKSGADFMRNSMMDIFGDDGDGVYDPMTDYLVTFYAPTVGAWKDFNDYSPVIALDYQDKRVMFTGDCEKKGEENFLKDIAEGKFSFDKKADVIKLGHHGSRTSTSAGYLDAVLPSKTGNSAVLAVVSCGFNNEYGHPHTETVNRLVDDYGFKTENILRTDTVGTVVLAVSGNKLIYGTVEFTQNSGFEPLSWITIGGGIVIVAFVLLFCIRVNRKGKAGVKNNAAAKIAGAAGVDVKNAAAPLIQNAPKPPAPSYPTPQRQAVPAPKTAASSAAPLKTPAAGSKPKTPSSSSKPKAAPSSDKDKIEKALKDVKKTLNKF